MVPVAADAQSGNDVVPEQLLHGGHHFDDIGGTVGRQNRQRWYEYNSEADGILLPREALHSYTGRVYLCYEANTTTFAMIVVLVARLPKLLHIVAFITFQLSNLLL